jgi:hypothetical protein
MVSFTVPMHTDYYCTSCDVLFRDTNNPNLNKRHSCGSHAKIVEFREGE